MSKNKEASGSGSGQGYQMIQPLRDPQANWEVDVAKNLEEYLLKICSGDVDGENEVNFAEAAMVIQNSIQVYSRKVEYLYSLVLNAWEFITQQSQSKQSEEDDESGDQSARDEGVRRSAPDDDEFWVSDDVPVEPNINLKDGECCLPDDFVKPPADLLVLEGDCLDAYGEGGELESYMLAKCELYRDFLLLDPSDAAAVDEYLKQEEQERVKKQNGVNRESFQHSPKSFLSPTREKGGSALKSPIAHMDQSPGLDRGFDFNEFSDNVPQNNYSEFEMDGGGDPGLDDDDESDEDDPWKPLNPHEPGNLKVKPFKKVKARGVDWSEPSKRISITKDFPLAPLHGPISSDLTYIWESRRRYSESQQSESPPLYEKLRQSLVLGEHGTFDEFQPKSADEDNEYDSEDDYSGPPEFDMPENAYMNEDHEDGNFHTDNANGNDVPTHNDNVYGNNDPTPDANLEELCHKHLDSLVANLNQIEKQTEMAARVSTWKQRIEQTLEEEDSLPPFDIHTYGEKVMEKLSEVNEKGETTMSFTDVVKGQEKHDVARTFSALLQLVNNGNVDLLRFDDNNNVLRVDDNDKERRVNENKERICYTAKKPFYVKLLRHKRRPEVQFRSSKKKAKSPATNTKASGGKGKSVQQNL